MSDGIWENSNLSLRYWYNARFIFDDNENVVIEINDNYSKLYFGKRIDNPYKYMSDKRILEYYRRKIREVVRIEETDYNEKLWKSDRILRYYNNGLTGKDVYNVHKSLSETINKL